MTPTERALTRQLTENTGMGLCDSGGAYGRNWERNQGRKFLDEPKTVLKFEKYGEACCIEIMHNVFHWLNERVEYDSGMTRKLKRFEKCKACQDLSWPEIMEAFAGEHGANEDSIGRVNTYNGDDCVSQVLAYHHWYVRDIDTEYVALQIHGGCDVRGGYTAPVIYQVWDGLFDNACAVIYCPHCRVRWDSDDGGHSWTPDEYSTPDIEVEPDGGLPLTDLPEREIPELLNLTADVYMGKVPDCYKYCDVGEFPEVPDRERGNLYVNDEGEALCPYCLTGTLRG